MSVFCEAKTSPAIRRCWRGASSSCSMARGRPNEAFLAAGRYIVDHCDVLFAVWDGLPAGAMGGTGDVVEYARRSERRVVHLNPIERRVITL